MPLLVGKRGVEHAADRRIEHLPVGQHLLERLAKPRGPDELAALLLLEEHVPAIEQVERVGEIDPPVGGEGHLPTKRDDFADLAALEGRRVPKPRALEEGDPDLPALRAVLDLRTREGARVALTRDREYTSCSRFSKTAMTRSNHSLPARWRREVLARRSDRGSSGSSWRPPQCRQRRNQEKRRTRRASTRRRRRPLSRLSLKPPGCLS